MLKILFHDRHLIAVHKPSGQFVHATNLDRTAGLPLLQEVRDEIGSLVFPFHRLDRAASGIVVFGLSPDTAAAMGRLFAARRVTKEYAALVRGFCTTCRIDRPLQRRRSRKAASPDNLQSAVTDVTCLRRYEIPEPSEQFATVRCSLIRAVPGTGRFHQLRRHLNGISHPIVGDTSHGDTRRNRIFRIRFGSSRLMLAATRLTFDHPVTGRNVCIECDPADDFQQVVSRLQPYATDDQSVGELAVRSGS
ncbi:MAG: pseudouridine synthase [Planctomycetaceae bacterium]